MQTTQEHNKALPWSYGTVTNADMKLSNMIYIG